jgi:D-amino peptidase
MTADVNAAVAGAAGAGAVEILVADGHDNAKNILIEELDPRARLYCGSPSPFSMVQGITEGVQAAFFIGYHAQMSAGNAILAHTWSASRVSNVWLNDRLVGEIGLNAAVCGHFGAPVLLVSGDQAACEEACEWIPGVEVVPVKKASGRQAAECLPPSLSQARIQETAGRAVQRFLAGQAPAPFRPTLPVQITIEFLTTLMVDKASLLPGSDRLDGRRLSFTAEDMPAAYRMFRAAITLAA